MAVALLVQNQQGAYVGIKFANREKAEEFEAHHQLEGMGVVPLLTQTEAALQGVLR